MGSAQAFEKMRVHVTETEPIMKPFRADSEVLTLFLRKLKISLQAGLFRDFSAILALQLLSLSIGP